MVRQSKKPLFEHDKDFHMAIRSAIENLEKRKKDPCGFSCEMALNNLELDKHKVSLSMWYTKVLQIKKKYNLATIEELTELTRRLS